MSMVIQWVAAWLFVGLMCAIGAVAMAAGGLVVVLSAPASLIRRRARQ